MQSLEGRYIYLYKIYLQLPSVWARNWCVVIYVLQLAQPQSHLRTTSICQSPHSDSYPNRYEAYCLF